MTIFLMLESFFKSFKFHYEDYDYIFRIENFEKFQVKVKHA